MKKKTIKVHCKDCKFWQETINEDGDILHACKRLHLCDTKPNDYCSFGEKKSEAV